MANGESSEDKGKTNGEDVKVNGDRDMKPKGGVKRGRVGELADEAKKTRRRSSMGMVLKNEIPQPPGQLLL